MFCKNSYKKSTQRAPSLKLIFLSGLKPNSPSLSKKKVCTGVRKNLAIQRNLTYSHFQRALWHSDVWGGALGRALIAPEPQGDPRKTPLAPKIGVTEHRSKNVFSLLNRKLLPLKISALNPAAPGAGKFARWALLSHFSPTFKSRRKKSYFSKLLTFPLL